MLEFGLNIALIAILFIFGLWQTISSTRRRARDVLGDLKDSAENINNSFVNHDSKSGAANSNLLFSDELGKAGLIDPLDRARFLLRQKLTPIICSLLFLATNFLSAQITVHSIIMRALLGLALGYIIERVRLKKMTDNYTKEIEFYLPIVMERIVMGVQAGLDVIPTVQSVLQLQRNFAATQSLQRVQLDPISRLLEIALAITERGLGFDQSLNDVAEMVECSALRHSFIHLALAYREGGEIILPLRELSDATQNYYQESIEEEIARMPVKATMPLIVTFAGLLIFFLTAPAMEMMNFTKRATQQAQGIK